VKRVGIFLIVVALVAVMLHFVGGDAGDGGVSYTLTINFTAGGRVTVNDVPILEKAVLAYDAGTVVKLNATPDSDCQFVGWTGDVNTVNDAGAFETIITVNSDHSITATFESPAPVQYTLDIIGPVHGSVTSPGEGRFIYEEGRVVNLVAEPASHYEFARWTGNVDTIADVNAPSTTITMSGDYYICAHFREAPLDCPAYS